MERNDAYRRRQGSPRLGDTEKNQEKIVQFYKKVLTTLRACDKIHSCIGTRSLTFFRHRDRFLFHAHAPVRGVMRFFAHAREIAAPAAPDFCYF